MFYFLLCLLDGERFIYAGRAFTIYWQELRESGSCLVSCLFFIENHVAALVAQSRMNIKVDYADGGFIADGFFDHGDAFKATTAATLKTNGKR